MIKNISYNVAYIDVVIIKGKYLVAWLAYRNVDRLTFIHIDARHFTTFRISVQYPEPR